MANYIPNYVPSTVRESSRNVSFNDIRIPNYLSVHPSTIDNKDNKMNDENRKAIHQKAMVNRNTELSRLENAYKANKISKRTYDICHRLFTNVVNDYHDTSLVDNGYFINMTDMVNFALNSADEKKVQHILYRYLFLTDVMVMDSYARNMPGLRESDKSLLKSTIEDILAYPYEVDLKQPRLLITIYENNANTPSTMMPSNTDDKYLIYRRLHEFGASPKGKDAQLNHFLVEDFITKYRAQIDDDLADTKISLAQFAFNTSQAFRR